jgi:hypothetical protein
MTINDNSQLLFKLFKIEAPATGSADFTTACYIIIIALA